MSLEMLSRKVKPAEKIPAYQQITPVKAVAVTKTPQKQVFIETPLSKNKRLSQNVLAEPRQFLLQQILPL